MIEHTSKRVSADGWDISATKRVDAPDTDPCHIQRLRCLVRPPMRIPSFNQVKRNELQESNCLGNESRLYT